ncbi:MAG: tRNA 2-thiouridine(34) synthase MnmA [Anaerolineaceae bacterium]|nr:tRNA 2-thiouridine(34) synthase MnmA [Anaerolineaceae bacterium]
MKKVVLALSGGVDSAVAAHLLQKQGYEVHGLNLLTWGEDTQRHDVQEIADKLNFEVSFLDIRQTFRLQVIQPFLDAYNDGLTPSPCLFCNPQVKWAAIINKANEIGAEFVATGHYVSLKKDDDGLAQIWKASDPKKDQSYMLSFLTQDLLQRTFFPLGTYSKAQIREIATELGMSVSTKPDSQDLCFLACGDYRDFLREHSDRKPQVGPIYNREGKHLGEHQGLPFYTIGQRKGLPASTEALYVIDKRIDDNSLIVGFLGELGSDTFYVDKLNWIDGKPLLEPITAETKIRYRATPVEAIITPLDAKHATVKAIYNLRDITPGQIAAFYDGDRLLGGGEIQ